MIREVRAWEADDGRTYPSELEAAKADAKYSLAKLECFNEASLNAVISHADEIHAALCPLIKCLPPKIVEPVVVIS